VLEHGRVVEEGNHQELLARKGLYARLFQMQAFAARRGEVAEPEAESKLELVPSTQALA